MSTIPLPSIPQVISMPLIAPPATATATASYYGGLPGTVAATDLGDAGLTFVLDQAADKTVFAAYAGSIRYLSAGQALPSGTPASVDSLVLSLLPKAPQELARRQPDGLPGITSFVYQGIDPATFQTVITAKVAALTEAQLNAAWRSVQGTDPTTQSLAARRAMCVTNVMWGLYELEVVGGERLGQVLADAANTSAYPLTFKAYEGQVVGKVNQVLAVSPLYFLRFLPEIAQSDVWLNHPLLAATSGFERGAQFYIGFQVSTIMGEADPITHEATPAQATYYQVEAGSQVNLYDRQGTDTLVASAVTNGNGIAFFDLTHAQVSGTPNYYFAIQAPTTLLTARGSTQPMQLPATWATALDSTRYWLAADGRTKGYLANFKGFRLGNAITPVWFNIGVDYFFEFSFAMPAPKLNSVNTLVGLLPQDLTVTLVSSAGVRIDHTLTNTSAIHGLSFALQPQDELTFEIPLELTNLAIGLQRTRVISVDQLPADTLLNFVTEYWRSKQDPAFLIYASVTSNSLRNTQVKNTIAKSIRITAAVASEALACLTYTRELATFLHYFTDGEYLGTELNLKLYHITEGLITGALTPFFPSVAVAIAKHLSLTPLSYPLHSIYLTEQEDERKRELVVHESSHQVMYTVADFSSANILQRFGHQLADSGAYHNSGLLSSPFLALTEGWAEAMGGIFCGYPVDECWGNSEGYLPLDEPARSSIPASGREGFYAPNARQYGSPWPDELNWLHDMSDVKALNLGWYSLDPGPYVPGVPSKGLNRGEESEGAFAMALYSIFWDFVIDPTLHQGLRYVRPDPTGNPTRSNAWMTPANQPAISRRFKALFWKPLQDLATEDSWFKKTSTRFLRGLAEHASALPASELNWSAVRARLLLWNMGLPHPAQPLSQFAWPELQSGAVAVPSGPRAGGNSVSYSGEGFVAPYTYKGQRWGTVFRSVYMKLFLGGQEVTNLVVHSATQLSFSAPARATPGPVRVTLQLWVRDVQVWESTKNDFYVYL